MEQKSPAFCRAFWCRDSVVEIYFFDGFFFASHVILSAAVAIAASFIDDVAFVDAVADFAFVELDVISTIVFFIDDVAAHVVEFRQCQRLNFGIVQVLEIDLVSVHFFSCLFVFGSYCFRGLFLQYPLIRIFSRVCAQLLK